MILSKTHRKPTAMRKMMTTRALIALLPALLLAGCGSKTDETPTTVPPPSAHAVPLAPVANKRMMGGNGRMVGGPGGGMNTKAAPSGGN